MPNEDGIANVGALAEMESQGHPILRMTSEIDQLGIGEVRTFGGRGQHSKNFEFSEVIELDKAT